MKKKEMAPSAKLKHSRSHELHASPRLHLVLAGVSTCARPHFMRPSFRYSSTITALALASALARSFFLKHNLRVEAKAGITPGWWRSKRPG